MSDPGKAVFLSYASQDAEAARKICDALRVAGVEVWFDQSELVGGDAWDQKIRKQIKECALFVPVISANTQARAEGYFRLEWKLAVDRSHLMADDEPFIFPVVIDETTDAAARVPDKFREVQWTRLSVKDTPASLAVRIDRLLKRSDGSNKPAPEDRGRRTEGGARTKPRFGLAGPIWATAVATVAVVVLGWVLFNRQAPPHDSAAPRSARPTEAAPTTPAQSPSNRPLSEARKLAAKADAMFEQQENMTRVGLDVADGLLKQALALDANDAEIWAVQARLCVNAYFLAYDMSPARRAAATEAANRATKLAPGSFEARFAQASVYRSQDAAALAEGERLLRELAAERPADRRAWNRLGEILRTRGRREESLAAFDRAIALPGPAPFTRFARSVTLQQLHRYAEAEADIDASLVEFPSGSTMLFKAMYLLTYHGDTAGAIAMLQRVPLDWQREDFGGAVAYAVWTAARQPLKAIAALDQVPRDFLNAAQTASPKGYLKGLALRDAGRQAAAELEWRGALQVVERRLVDTPTDARLLKAKAAVLACLGPRLEAEQALELYRQVSGQRGVTWNETLDRVYWDIGLRDEVLAVFARVLADQERGSWFVSRPILRVSPIFDPLRGDPRFEALLVEPSAQRTGDSGQSAMGTVKVDAKSVAVLAFANLSDDKDNEYFSDGISEELLNVLAKVPGLKVSARTSAFSFKGKGVAIPEIARQLGVAYVVEGSVRKAGNRVRITAQLIKASDGFHVWSDNFDRELKDIFAVQDEIAGLIATNLQLKLAVDPRAAKAAVNPEVYRLYLEARQAWNLRNEAGYERAESLLNQVLVLDPNFARAHAALSDVWLTRGQDTGTVGARGQIDGPQMARLTQAAERAVALDPASAEARASLGNAFKHQWKLEDAEREFRAAINLNPNYASAHQWLGRALMDMGRFEAGIGELQRAVELDPLSSRIADNLSDGWLRAGRPGEALALAERALSLQPDSPQAKVFRAMALAHLERSAEAIQATAGIDRSRWSMFIAYVLAVAGDATAAERELRGSDVKVDVSESAGAWFALGRKTEGLAALVPDAIKINNVSRLYVFPVFDPMRDDPRFLQAIADMGVTEYYRRAQAWRTANQRTEDGGRRTDKSGSTK